jgi:transcriptional regulator with XRE-family HTH domain
MAYPRYLREKARTLRSERRLTLDEIAQRLALPRTTVWYWIRDLPLDRPRRASAGQRKGVLAMQAKYRRLREQAYAQGEAEFDDLVVRPTFREFVVLYIAEGSKRDRNRIAIGNSDPRIVCMAAG